MANYASVNNVYERTRDLLNKNQLGFVTPSQFNVLAQQAQQELFDETIDLLNLNLKYRLRNLDTKGKDIKRSYEDDLSTLLVYNESIAAASGTNIFNVPDRVAYLRDAEYEGTPIALISPRESVHYKRNRYAPSLTTTLGILGNHQIEVIPDDITENISVTYYKHPMGSRNGVASNNAPQWAYTQSGEDLLYNASSSYDFELPKHMEAKLTDRILSLLGVTLRETEVVQYSEAKKQKDEE